jgi:hypothetical protein
MPNLDQKYTLREFIITLEEYAGDNPSDPIKGALLELTYNLSLGYIEIKRDTKLQPQDLEMVCKQSY